MGVGYTQAWDAENRLSRADYGSTDKRIRNGLTDGGSDWLRAARCSRTVRQMACAYDPRGASVIYPLFGRLEFLVDGALAASWVDTSPLPAGSLGLATWNSGTSAFDDVGVRGVASRSYYVEGGRVAMRQTDIEVTAEAGTVAWLHGDHLGSTSLATQANGAELSGSHARYLPFGEPRGTAAELPTDFAFTGGRTSDLGLVHLGARFYDPRLARWTSADTLVPSRDPQQLNRYSYVVNRPLMFTDPSGHGCGNDPELCALLYPPHSQPPTASPFATPSPAPVPTPRPTGTPMPRPATSGSSALSPFTYEPPPFTFSAWELEVLANLDKSGPLGEHAADYLRDNQIHFDIVSADNTAGASWHILWYWNGHLGSVITWGQALMASDNPDTLALLVHEAWHLEQGPQVALSVEGELEAWQRHWTFYQHLTGTPLDPILQKLVALPMGPAYGETSRQTLVDAQYLMWEYTGGPKSTYRIYWLPLWPLLSCNAIDPACPE